MAEPNLIYKITILELLHRSGFPLSNSQITDFFLEGNLTDYFSAQQAISDDEEAGLIVSKTTHNSTTYAITEEGQKTLELFSEKISTALSKDINKYLKQNSITMKEENSYKATYFKADRGGFVVQLRITENDVPTMDLSFHVGTKEIAETLCNNWKVRSEDVYGAIIDILLN
jgi:DNA-binding PadR family transcriptional regulator